MPRKYHAVPLDDLIDVPTRAQSNISRANVVANLLRDKLNQMSNDGWELVTSWKSASGTIFVFATNPHEHS